MKKVWENYKNSIYLIISIVVGAIIGLIFKEKTNYIKPLGDLFINLLTCIIVPIIFLNISTSIGKMNKPKRVGKVLITTFIIFLMTSIISALLGIIASNITPLVKSVDYIYEVSTP